LSRIIPVAMAGNAHSQRDPRRVVVIAHDRFGPFTSKTAMAVIRYGSDQVVGVVDRSKGATDAREHIGAIGEGIPVVPSMEDALRFRPDAVIFGWAPEGGSLPGHDRDELLVALRSGLDVVSGLHDFLGDDPEMVEAARLSGASITDLRRPPERRRLVTGDAAEVRSRVVLVSGTDCSTGKMTVAIELVREARDRGLDAAFVATGQSGMVIGCDAGAPIDAIAGDFMAGEVEAMVLEVAHRRPDLIVVEGQGALGHPAYGAVTLAILQGSYPDAVVMCHDPGRKHYKALWQSTHPPKVPSLRAEISRTEEALENTSGGRVAAVAVMAMGEDPVEEAQREAIIRSSLHLTVADVFKEGPSPLLDAVLQAPLGHHKEVAHR
jgi:uncharacterized NAD-dependent epimerase/dehydratase family protein